ncbi:hypothetical protein CIRMBP1248_01881 [Enterococcus cecorum]|nr:hypothetical protein CIRMBP1256_01642 [Enterococcus cecorum]CAI3427056.1 hypothetical protein CIRMBP1248_01881 [Enterococcus cecorum]
MIGEVIQVEQLKTVEATAKLFDKSRWRIINGWAKKFTTIFDNGKPIEVYYAEKPVEEIYPNIRLLFDKRDRVIAQRPSAKAVLRVGVQGNWKTRVKVSNHLKPRKLGVETTTKAYNQLKNLKIIN